MKLQGDIGKFKLPNHKELKGFVRSFSSDF